MGTIAGEALSHIFTSLASGLAKEGLKSGAKMKMKGGGWKRKSRKRRYRIKQHGRSVVLPPFLNYNYRQRYGF